MRGEGPSASAFLRHARGRACSCSVGEALRGENTQTLVDVKVLYLGI